MYRRIRNVILGFRDSSSLYCDKIVSYGQKWPHSSVNYSEWNSVYVCICLYDKYWSRSLKKDKFDSPIGNKLSLYSEVNNEVRFESYLDLITNVKTIVAVTKMRISCLLLPIESGRYKKIPRVERLCPLCNRSEIGDEFHYLLKCTHSSLSDIRGISHIICLVRHYFYVPCLCAITDKNILNLSASYIKYILNCYASEL